MKTYTKAVSATLAGALAVGMVPAMALADDDSVELLDQTEANAIANGTISFEGGLEAGAKFEAGSETPYLVPVSVEIADGVEKAVTTVRIYKLDGTAMGTTGTHKMKNADGELVAFSYSDFGLFKVSAQGIWSATASSQMTVDDLADLAVGEYAVAVGVGSATDTDLVIEAVPFEVTAKDIEKATFFQPKDENEDYADTTFVFNGNEWNAGAGDTAAIKLVRDGEEISFTPGAYYNSKNQELTESNNYGSIVPVAAGKYSVDVTGAAGDYEDSEGTIGFEIKAVDLKDVAFTLSAQDAEDQYEEPGIVGYTIDGVAYTGDDMTLVEAEIFDVSFDKPVNGAGAYTATIELKAAVVASKGWTGSITGSTTVDFVLGENQVDLSGATYAGQGWFDNDGDTAIEYAAADLRIDRSDEDYAGEFDPAKVVLPKVNSKAAVYTLEYEKLNDKGAWVDATLAEVTDKSAYGVFRVRAVLDAKHYGYEYYGQTDWMEIATTNGAIDTNKITFVYNDKGTKKVVSNNGTTPAVAVPYTGADVLDSLAVTVKTASGATASEADWDLKVTKKANPAKPGDKDAVVSEIVDAGTYEIVLESSKYELDDAEYGITVVVSQADVAPVILNHAGEEGEYVALYTGEVIDPVKAFMWDNDDNAATPQAALDLPAGAYKVEIVSYKAKENAAATKATEIKEAGFYTLKLTDADPFDNYDVAEDLSIDFEVTKKDVFRDVPADAWFAGEVFAVANAGIIGGYGDTGYFGPYDSAERQDAMVMFFRLLNADERLGAAPTDIADLIVGGVVDGTVGGALAGEIILPYSDANGKAYYAPALKYGYDSKIMTGYSDSDEFGVGDAITREQVATILFRIDEGGFYDDDDYLMQQASALDAYADAGEISKYAVPAMEWAVANGIFGVNAKFLNPGDDITRAELAAVIARYATMRGISLEAPGL